MAPDMSAEAGLAAAGWALGSQTWKGTTPAFEPKPTSARRKAMLRVRGDKWAAWARIATKDWSPVCPDIRTKASNMAAAPAWVITAYHSPAARESALRR